ncbi:hypothetical protein HBH56_026100 [Parastagonospora nodorum]|nr:hypothetical protein HBH56_026100 [Parastagonospora nodorum]KAH3975916.1 hypothetical protein HBH51_081750 [Parastagonospora nodorum]KAH4064976.1 hypothetical protein HBH50_169580 [Parastagonospora nodorum]KAH4089297.1 hypothetical protein HBH48_111310 [Parastagonospora nodorum]KAH4096342.1 hypothetical protein HBH46_166730 [Parastagonospora nodorum]
MCEGVALGKGGNEDYDEGDDEKDALFYLQHGIEDPCSQHTLTSYFAVTDDQGIFAHSECTGRKLEIR